MLLLEPLTNCVSAFPKKKLSVFTSNIEDVKLSVTSKIVEIYIDNVCNFSCVYCASTLSSKIDAEVKKFGEFKHNTISITSTKGTSENQKNGLELRISKGTRNP